MLTEDLTSPCAGFSFGRFIVTKKVQVYGNLLLLDQALNQLEHGLRSRYPYMQKAYKGIAEKCPNAHGAFSSKWEKQGPYRHNGDKYFRATMATLYDKGKWYLYIPTGRNGIKQNYQDVWYGIDSLMVIISDKQGVYRIVMVDCTKLYEFLERDVPPLYAKYPNATCKLSFAKLNKLGLIQDDFEINNNAKTYTLADGDIFDFKPLSEAKFPAWDKYTLRYRPAPKKELTAFVFNGNEVEEFTYLGVDEVCVTYGVNKMQVKNSMRERSLVLRLDSGAFVSFINKKKHNELLNNMDAKQEWINKRKEAATMGRKIRSDKGKTHKMAKDYRIELMETAMLLAQLRAAAARYLLAKEIKNE
jgi:hypothetical protein